MNCTYIIGKNCPVGEWSGGKTTELFIWPEGSRYGDRDFTLRVSTATVDIAQSTFTNLPGYLRLLTPIKNRIRLCHHGHGEETLNPYDVSRFDGAWDTVSYGECTDFGLMLGKGWDGRLQKISNPDLICRENSFTGIYASEFRIPYVVSDEINRFEGTLETGDMLLVHCGLDENVTINLLEMYPALLFAAWPDNNFTKP